MDMFAYSIFTSVPVGRSVSPCILYCIDLCFFFAGCPCKLPSHFLCPTRDSFSPFLFFCLVYYPNPCICLYLRIYISCCPCGCVCVPLSPFECVSVCLYPLVPLDFPHAPCVSVFLSACASVSMSICSLLYSIILFLFIYPTPPLSLALFLVVPIYLRQSIISLFCLCLSIVLSPKYSFSLLQSLLIYVSFSDNLVSLFPCGVSLSADTHIDQVASIGCHEFNLFLYLQMSDCEYE